MNTTVGQLVTLTQMLQIELNDIATQITALRTMCSAASGALPAFCNMIIPSVSYTVVANYSAVSVLCVRSYVHVHVSVAMYMRMSACICVYDFRYLWMCICRCRNLMFLLYPPTHLIKPAPCTNVTNESIPMLVYM